MFKNRSFLIKIVKDPEGKSEEVEVLDVVKTHFEKHKTAYLLAAGVGIAGITWYIMRGQHAGFLRSPDTADSTVFVRPLSFFSRQNVVTVIERESRGHPGYMIQCLETGETWGSQAKAAIDVGTSAQNMSSHIRGKFPDIYGLHYERILA